MSTLPENWYTEAKKFETILDFAENPEAVTHLSGLNEYEFVSTIVKTALWSSNREFNLDDPVTQNLYKVTLIHFHQPERWNTLSLEDQATLYTLLGASLNVTNTRTETRRTIYAAGERFSESVALGTQVGARIAANTVVGAEAALALDLVSLAARVSAFAFKIGKEGNSSVAKMNPDILQKFSPELLTSEKFKELSLIAPLSDSGLAYLYGLIGDKQAKLEQQISQQEKQNSHKVMPEQMKPLDGLPANQMDNNRPIPPQTNGSVDQDKTLQSIGELRNDLKILKDHSNACLYHIQEEKKRLGDDQFVRKFLHGIDQFAEVIYGFTRKQHDAEREKEARKQFETNLVNRYKDLKFNLDISQFNARHDVSYIKAELLSYYRTATQNSFEKKEAYFNKLREELAQQSKKLDELEKKGNDLGEKAKELKRKLLKEVKKFVKIKHDEELSNVAQGAHGIGSVLPFPLNIAAHGLGSFLDHMDRGERRELEKYLAKKNKYINKLDSNYNNYVSLLGAVKSEENATNEYLNELQLELIASESLISPEDYLEDLRAILERKNEKIGKLDGEIAAVKEKIVKAEERHPIKKRPMTSKEEAAYRKEKKANKAEQTTDSKNHHKKNKKGKKRGHKTHYVEERSSTGTIKLEKLNFDLSRLTEKRNDYSESGTKLHETLISKGSTLATDQANYEMNNLKNAHFTSFSTISQKYEPMLEMLAICRQGAEVFKDFIPFKHSYGWFELSPRKVDMVQTSAETLVSWFKIKELLTANPKILSASLALGVGATLTTAGPFATGVVHLLSLLSVILDLKGKKEREIRKLEAEYRRQNFIEEQKLHHERFKLTNEHLLLIHRSVAHLQLQQKQLGNEIITHQYRSEASLNNIHTSLFQIKETANIQAFFCFFDQIDKRVYEARSLFPDLESCTSLLTKERDALLREIRSLHLLAEAAHEGGCNGSRLTGMIPLSLLVQNSGTTPHVSYLLGKVAHDYALITGTNTHLPLHGMVPNYLLIRSAVKGLKALFELFKEKDLKEQGNEGESLALYMMEHPLGLESYLYIKESYLKLLGLTTHFSTSSEWLKKLSSKIYESYNKLADCMNLESEKALKVLQEGLLNSNRINLEEARSATLANFVGKERFFFTKLLGASFSTQLSNNFRVPENFIENSFWESYSPIGTNYSLSPDFSIYLHQNPANNLSWHNRRGDRSLSDLVKDKFIEAIIPALETPPQLYLPEQDKQTALRKTMGKIMQLVVSPIDTFNEMRISLRKNDLYGVLYYSTELGKFVHRIYRERTVKDHLSDSQSKQAIENIVHSPLVMVLSTKGQEEILINSHKLKDAGLFVGNQPPFKTTREMDQYHSSCRSEIDSYFSNLKESNGFNIIQSDDEAGVPLLLPDHYFSLLNSQPLAQGIKILEKIGLGLIFNTYSLREADGKYYLCLNYKCIDRKKERTPLFSLVLAEFDSATVNAFKGYAKGETSKPNINEFLIQAMKGTQYPDFPISGTRDLTGHGDVNVNGGKFIGLEKIFTKLGNFASPIGFRYNLDNFNAVENGVLEEWASNDDHQLPQGEGYHFQEVGFVFSEDYALMKKDADSVLEEVCQKILANESYKKWLNEYRLSYSTLISIMRIVSGNDPDLMIDDLEELNIYNPDLFPICADHVLNSIVKINSLSRKSKPPEYVLEDFFQDATKVKSEIRGELQSLGNLFKSPLKGFTNNKQHAMRMCDPNYEYSATDIHYILQSLKVKRILKDFDIIESLSLNHIIPRIDQMLLNVKAGKPGFCIFHHSHHWVTVCMVAIGNRIVTLYKNSFGGDYEGLKLLLANKSSEYKYHLGNEQKGNRKVCGLLAIENMLIMAEAISAKGIESFVNNFDTLSFCTLERTTILRKEYADLYIEGTEESNKIAAELREKSNQLKNSHQKEIDLIIEQLNRVTQSTDIVIDVKRSEKRSIVVEIGAENDKFEEYYYLIRATKDISPGELKELLATSSFAWQENRDYRVENNIVRVTKKIQIT